MLPCDVRMEGPAQTHEDEPPLKQQVDKEGQTSEAELTSEESFCESCMMGEYSETQSEIHMEEVHAGSR